MDHRTESPASAAITGMVWRKSTASNNDANAGCIEVALTQSLVLVRDSKDVTGPHLRFGRSAWKYFAGSPPSGELE